MAPFSSDGCRQNRVAGYDAAKVAPDRKQRGIMRGLNRGGGAVGNKRNTVVAHEGVTRRRFDAHVRGLASHYHRPDHLRPENEIEVGRDKTAVAMLGDDELVAARLAARVGVRLKAGIVVGAPRAW